MLCSMYCRHLAWNFRKKLGMMLTKPQKSQQKIDINVAVTVVTYKMIHSNDKSTSLARDEVCN